MLRILRFVAVMAIGLILGFASALYFTWTGALEYSHQEASYQIITAADGSLLKIPVHEVSTSVSAHSEPYRPAPVVDLFDNKGKP